MKTGRMSISQRSLVNDQLTAIMSRHLDDLKGYFAVDPRNVEIRYSELLNDLDKLASICAEKSDSPSEEMFSEVAGCKQNIEHFLALMNQAMTDDFATTPIGRILGRVDSWGKTMEPSVRTVPAKAVWELIAPIQPDSLRELGSGLYEATWWHPVPMMDIELLRLTETIDIKVEPYEPEVLPGGISVRFNVVS